MARARALENGCYIAHVDLAGDSHLGMSRVYDPQGESFASAKAKKEVVVTASIPLITSDEIVHHAYITLRRPELYNNVISYDTELPWKRDTRESVQQFFKNRAQYYDRQMEGVYKGPTIANALAAFVTNKDRKVLDVAAGTGLVGQALHHEGFRNLIALDRSPAMLQCLNQKQVYRETIQGDFEQEAKKVPDGTYHACVCVGAFLTGGFLNPVIAAKEMVRMAEAGGYVLLLWNATELEELQCKETKENLEGVIDAIVRSGKCEVAQMSTVPKYLEECIGQLVILKKVESGL